MNKRYIYALGVFDGVHRGHQALLTACRHLAQRTGCQPGAVTFGSHPDALITGNTPLLLCSVKERSALLSCYLRSCDVVVLPFDEELRHQHWRDFLEMLVQKGAAGFVCGDDFRFGFRGEGNADRLAEFCKEQQLYWAVVSGQELDGVRISSTHIRKLIEEGEMEKAVEFLGHPHSMTGTVVSGRQLGRTIGIPTANLLIPEGVVTPKFGVYACQTVIDGRSYMAVTNVGNRPTVGGHRVTIEPWILDFEGDLYGKALSLLFYKFLRPEKKFSSLETLQAEIFKNAEETRKFFENS